MSGRKTWAVFGYGCAIEAESADLSLDGFADPATWCVMPGTDRIGAPPRYCPFGLCDLCGDTRDVPGCGYVYPRGAAYVGGGGAAPEFRLCRTCLEREMRAVLADDAVDPIIGWTPLWACSCDSEFHDYSCRAFGAGFDAEDWRGALDLPQRGADKAVRS